MKRRTSYLSTITAFLLFFCSPCLHLASAFTAPRRPPSTSTRGGFGAATAATFSHRQRTFLLFVKTQEKETTAVVMSNTADDAGTSNNADKKKDVTDDNDKEKSEEQNLLDKIKEAGLAGVISYAFWELAFWFISIPITLVGYLEVTGHWPDLSNQDDLAKLGAEAFAFVNLARLAVPIRIGLAISTIPWVEENVVERFSLLKNKDETTTKEVADAAADATAADKQQKGSENGNIITSSLESSTGKERKKGLVKRILSRLPFRRHSNE